MDITVADVIEALRGAQGVDGQGLTTHEIADSVGLSIDLTRKYLRAGLDAGRLQVARRTSRTIDGRRCYVPVYSVTS